MLNNTFLTRQAMALCFLSILGCTPTLSGSGGPAGHIPASPLQPLELLRKVQDGLPVPQPQFVLSDPGSPAVIDYSRFGTIEGAGTTQYRYVINDADQLKKAIGEGVYPNETGIYKDPDFLKLKDQGALEGSVWNYLTSNDLKAAFYAWARSYEDKGVKTYFTAKILEKAGLLLPAIKAYYAAVIHFPRSACWAADKTFVWYIAPAAIADIQRLTRDYPRLDLELVGASFSIRNGNDTDLMNDIISVNPGHFMTRTLDQKRQAIKGLKSLSVVETRGEGRVQVVKFQNGHWQLRVGGRPFFVRGITYLPTEIGLGPQDPHFDSRWMFLDKDHNGKIDAPYDAWVDRNGNGPQDADAPAVGDFQLMKDIGVNAIRFYVPNKTAIGYDPALVNKPLLRDLYEKYGISVIAGDYLGAYTLGSGATWEKGTDYTDPQQRRTMLATVRAKVLDLKDEPFLLMWILGNENNMAADYSGVNATRTNASVHPEAYAQFLQEVAQMIHQLDPNHPVAVGNIETDLLDKYNQLAPAIDVLGINSYRGSQGFGDLWEDVRGKFDRPVLITEYGCDAYFQGRGVDEEGQFEYHRGNFRDIVFNQAGGPYAGNAIGGVIFEYTDEWWKDTRNDPNDRQQTNATFSFPFPDGFDHEEWLGITGQGSGKKSPFERRLRKAYFYYKEMSQP
jgi:beta-glucuronidase